MNISISMRRAREEIDERISKEVEEQILRAIGTGKDLATWTRYDSTDAGHVKVTLFFRLVEPGTPTKAPEGCDFGRLYETSRQAMGRA